MKFKKGHCGNMKVSNIQTKSRVSILRELGGKKLSILEEAKEDKHTRV